MAGVLSSEDVVRDRVWFHTVSNDSIGGSERGMRQMKMAMDRQQHGQPSLSLIDRRRRLAGEDAEEMGLPPRGPPRRP